MGSNYYVWKGQRGGVVALIILVRKDQWMYCWDCIHQDRLGGAVDLQGYNCRRPIHKEAWFHKEARFCIFLYCDVETENKFMIIKGICSHWYSNNVWTVMNHQRWTKNNNEDSEVIPIHHESCGYNMDHDIKSATHLKRSKCHNVWRSCLKWDSKDTNIIGIEVQTTW